jgi:hypothetical protein
MPLAVADKMLPGIAPALLYRSYAKHGNASVTCEVCTCEPSVLTGYWDVRNSQLDLHPVKTTPSQECRITITGEQC